MHWIILYAISSLLLSHKDIKTYLTNAKLKIDREKYYEHAKFQK